MPLKLFIEVVSCKKDRIKQDAARDTWIKEWGHLIDYKFLLGRGNNHEAEDEWVFDVGDSWDEKIHKIVECQKRLLVSGYDYVFHISLDCYPIVPRLLAHARTLGGKQYVGSKSGGGDFLGEAGFWMGREVMAVLFTNNHKDVSYEDQYIGHLLAQNGILPTYEHGFESGDQTSYIFPYKDPLVWQTTKRDQCSVHLGRGSGTFQPEWMYDCHKSYMENGDHHYPRPGL